ncbi:PAS-domain containing protein, partial [Amaricoccus sp.]|uniref:PAS domain-containing protein n=1 Tax=Amaricoccus sp. TaxID=1872485 RepID=UPI002CD096FF
KYRSELELSQATLDRMSEAVAVFDASGMLVFVNSAFETLWGLDPMEGLNGPGVAEMCALWTERCAPSPVWARLAEFATAGAEARTSWTAPVETRDGIRLDVLVAPLPDTSALVVFRTPAPEAQADGTLSALALEQLRLPAEAAVEKLAAAIPTARSTAAFQALSGAAQGLRDGLDRARELEAAGTGPDAAPLAGAAAALARRGLRLDLPDAARAWTAPERRLALALAFAAADAAAPGAAIAIAGDAAALTATVEAAATPARGESLGLALARRLAEASGGSLAAATDAGTATFTATLPTAARTLRSA